VLPLRPPVRAATLSFGGLIALRARLGSAARPRHEWVTPRAACRCGPGATEYWEKDMRIRRQTTRATIAAVLLGLFLCASARAQQASVFDQVPADALVVVRVKN